MDDELSLLRNFRVVLKALVVKKEECNGRRVEGVKECVVCRSCVADESLRR